VLLFAGGTLVFLVIGTVAFRIGAAPALVPMALLAGALAMVGLAYLVPGTQGYCD
jgi:hypothetical protein